jgi:hypothetical protein
VILDWALATWGPAALDFAGFLANFRWRLAAPPDHLIDDIRTACGDRHDERMLQLALLATFTNYGWIPQTTRQCTRRCACSQRPELRSSRPQFGARIIEGDQAVAGTATPDCTHVSSMSWRGVGCGGGVCVIGNAICEDPLVDCGGFCVDLGSDSFNCGSCVLVCPPQTPSCVAGECTL